MLKLNPGLLHHRSKMSRRSTQIQKDSWLNRTSTEQCIFNKHYRSTQAKKTCQLLTEPVTMRHHGGSTLLMYSEQCSISILPCVRVCPLFWTLCTHSLVIAGYRALGVTFGTLVTSLHDAGFITSQRPRFFSRGWCFRG